MLKRPIIIGAFKLSIKQSAYVFIILIEVTILVLIIFGIHLEYHQDILISLKVFGKIFDDMELLIFQRVIVKNIISTIISILIFLLIILSSYFSFKSTNHPLLPVIIIRRITRTNYYLSYITGLILSVMINIISFAFLCSIILYIKGSPWTYSLIYSALSFCVEFITITSMATMFSIIIGSSSASVLLTMAVYYILSPLISANYEYLSCLFKLVASIIPNIFDITTQTKEYALGHRGLLLPYIKCLLHATLYQTVCILLFIRRDLN